MRRRAEEAAEPCKEDLSGARSAYQDCIALTVSRSEQPWPLQPATLKICICIDSLTRGGRRCDHQPPPNVQKDLSVPPISRVPPLLGLPSRLTPLSGATTFKVLFVQCVSKSIPASRQTTSQSFANKTGYPSKRESFLMDTFQLQPVYLSARTLLQPKPTTRRRPTSANALSVGVLNLHWYHQWGDHETAHVI
ncbi:predicted protein [Thalassiosira pseudonana CCMP1335]|uniref:Uncharacterized protein n=1 Tax=Thalassiosira pseudonana TaxID=35128 RepID=B8LDQ1_THAPS|nr:predicted protein [Thalassiosira pseudonana CCMP1335]EED86476.1 predicted protein [Thalassiosira pseudonana CCMP1335]|eukprot:scaffold1379_cov209-Alexandrium_tamarense.AAC.15